MKPAARTQRACAQPTRFHARPVAAACALLLLGHAGAQAQEAQSVTLTGIRASIESSIQTKRNSDAVVESISAEDIGKLPDTSIADAISRLPGLAAQRIDGRPAAISIRGLGPDYAGALLNGRQVVSSGDGRSAEYDQFPSELINQVIVYKTSDASVVGQGLSGTIDIRPLSPLSLRSRQVNLGARLERNSNGALSSTGKGANGSRFSASYVDQFADRTVGVAIGFAHLDSPGQEKKYEAWRFGDYTGQWGNGSTGVPSLGVGNNKAQFQQGFEASNTSSKQVRDGVMAVLEYKPNKSLTSTLDLYYSKFTQDRVGHHWVGDIGLWSGPPAAFSNVGTTELNGNTIISSGNVANGHSLIYNKNFHRTDTIKSLGWRNELKIDDNWKGTADVGMSRADRDERYVQSVARPLVDQGFSFANLDTVDRAMWTTTQNLTDPAAVVLTNNPDWAELRTPKYKDEIKSLKLTVNRSLDWMGLASIEAGLAYNQRDKEVQSDAFRLSLAAAGVPIPAAAVRAPVSINVGGINTNVISWDVPSVMGLYTAVPKDPWSAKDNKYGVHEKVSTAFLKADIDTKLGDVPLRGNIGLQVVHTKQSSEGFGWNDGGTKGGPSGGAVVPVQGGASYTDVLPSLSLVFSLQPDLLLRVGLAKNMARPRMDDMRAGADQPKLTAIDNDPATTIGTWSAGNGGKPDLKPWRAKALDLSLEKYLNKRSYVAVAGFLKHLDSFIYQLDTVRDFSGFVNYSPTLKPGCKPINPNCNPNLGTITTQDNGEGGKVYGLEFSGSLDGGLISPALSGFGLIASQSVTRNKLPNDKNGNPIKLDGFSGIVNSIAAYYENAGFSARISQRYRSAFTATTRSVLLNTETSTRIDAEKQVDMQVGYNFEEGPMKGLSLLLQVNNLTNAPAVQRRGPEVVGTLGDKQGMQPWKYDNFGRVVLLGATYKF